MVIFFRTIRINSNKVKLLYRVHGMLMKSFNFLHINFLFPLLLLEINKEIRILNSNIRGIRTKIHHIVSLIQTYKPDFILILETDRQTRSKNHYTVRP